MGQRGVPPDAGGTDVTDNLVFDREAVLEIVDGRMDILLDWPERSWTTIPRYSGLCRRPYSVPTEWHWRARPTI